MVTSSGESDRRSTTRASTPSLDSASAACEAARHHRPVRDDGAGVAVADDAALADPGPSAGELAVLLRPVPAFGSRTITGSGSAIAQSQQPVRVERRRGHDHLQPGGVHVVRLGALAVVLLAADPAERRDADHDRHVDSAPRALPVLRDVADHLVERRVGEPVELHLDHGSSIRRSPSPTAAPAIAGLGDRRVEHPLGAELRSAARR